MRFSENSFFSSEDNNLILKIETETTRKGLSTNLKPFLKEEQDVFVSDSVPVSLFFYQVLWLAVWILKGETERKYIF